MRDRKNPYQGSDGTMKKIAVFIFTVAFALPVLSQTLYRTLFDDFENLKNKNSFGGAWYTANDKQNVLSGQPSSAIKPDPFELVPQGAGKSGFCAYLTYDLLVSSYNYPFAFIGGNLTDSGMGNDDNVFRDISEFSGICFWARAETNVHNLALRFTYKNYAGQYGETPREYVIGSEATAPLSGIPHLSTDWQIFVIPFSKFSIPSWVATDPNYGGKDADGTVLFDPLQTAHQWDKIKSVLFQTAKSTKEGGTETKGTFYIDNVYFVSAPAAFTFLDSDQDNFNDYVEYAAGSNPKDKDSTPYSLVLNNNLTGIAEPVSILELDLSANPVLSGTGLDIAYTLSAPGTGVTVSCMIFDTKKNVIAKINSSGPQGDFSTQTPVGTSGLFHWTGCTEQGGKVKKGIYVVLLKSTHQGKSGTAAKTVIVE